MATQGSSLNEANATAAIRADLAATSNLSPGDVLVTSRGVFVSSTEPQPLTSRTLHHHGRHAWQGLIDGNHATSSSFFETVVDGRPALAEVRVRAHYTPKDEAHTRAAWCGREQPSEPIPFGRHAQPRGELAYRQANALYCQLCPKNWATLADMALVYPGAERFISFGVVVHAADDSPPRSISYGLSRRGESITDATAAAVLRACGPGIQTRFGLTFTGPDASLASRTGFGRHFTMTVKRASEPIDLLAANDGLVQLLRDHPSLYATEWGVGETAKRLSSLSAPFRNNVKQARRFLKELSSANQDKVALHLDESRTRTMAQSERLAAKAAPDVPGPTWETASNMRDKLSSKRKYEAHEGANILEREFGGMGRRRGGSSSRRR